MRGETGFQALEHISRYHRIEVLITDVNMPGMSGNELAQRASCARPDLPVMLLSGREPRSSRFPLIRKPFLQQDLAAAMVQETGRACGSNRRGISLPGTHLSAEPHDHDLANLPRIALERADLFSATILVTSSLRSTSESERRAYLYASSSRSKSSG